MTTTYELITEYTVPTAAATVTIGNIPATYTDLNLLCSLRSDYNSSNNNAYAYFNANDTGTEIFVYGDGSSATGHNINYNESYIGGVNAAQSTSGTFTNFNLYIPNYLSSNYKSGVQHSAMENNGGCNMYLASKLWSYTAAITSITFRLQFSTYSVGSTFYLYGIKNS